MMAGESRFDFEAFFDHSVEMLCIANHDGYFLELNPRWSEVLGFTIEDLKAKPFVEFVHPDDRNSTVQEAQRIAESGQLTVDFCNRYIDVNGSYHWLQWSATTGRDGLIYAAARDITQLMDQTRYFEETQETAEIGYWRLDLENNIPFWTKKVYEIYELPYGEQVPLERLYDCFPENLQSKVRNLVKDGLENGDGWDEELPFVTFEGNEKWVRAIGKPYYSGDSVAGVYGTIQDITPFKSVSEKLKLAFEETKKYKRGLDNQAIVAITDTRGVIQYVNQKFCEASGYSESELIGKTHKIVNSGYHSEEFFKSLWTTIEAGEIWRGLIKNRSKSGQDYWVDTAITPIKDTNGNISEYMAIRYNVTERVRLQEKVRQQQEQLNRSSRLAALGEMAGGIAHEINNPLAILIGHSNRLRRILEKNDVEINELNSSLVTIENTIDRISSVVGSLRTFSRDDYKEKFTVVPVEKIIEDSLFLCREKFHNYGITVIPEVDQAAEVQCNSIQISQVLINLLNNSFYEICNKEDRRIWLKVLAESEGQRVNFVVQDSGHGVPNDIQDKIFEPFFTTKPIGEGTGMGLGISMRIAKAHGGQLKYSLQEGRTTFTLSLPCKQPLNPNQSMIFSP